MQWATTGANVTDFFGVRLIPWYIKCVNFDAMVGGWEGACRIVYAQNAAEDYWILLAKTTSANMKRVAEQLVRLK